jgi:hypothetical protein
MRGWATSTLYRWLVEPILYDGVSLMTYENTIL